MATEFVDLLMDNGEIVRIEYKDKYMDDFLDYLENCIKRQDSWCASRFEGTSAEYMGLGIDKVNTKRIIGQL